MKKERRVKAAAFKAEMMPEGLDRDVGRPLHMRGLILEHPRTGRAAHLCWDQQGFWKSQGDMIRQAVADAAGIPFPSVMLTATHTHRGVWKQLSPNPSFVDFVIEKTARTAGQAIKYLEPVRAGWKSIQAPGIRRNRSVYLDDGRAYTERWAIPSSWHIPEEDILRRGPDDDELRMLVLERLDGRRLAVCACFSCHNSAALREPRLTDDFFGVASEIIEDAEGCVALISPGSEGDQDPTAMVELGGARDMCYAARAGRRLAGSILMGISDVPMHDVFNLHAASIEVKVPVREDWRSLAVGHPNEEIREWGQDGFIPGELTAIALGDFAMVGIPAELFTAPARIIREHSPFLITSSISLSNGMVMYVADKEDFFEGSQIYAVHAGIVAAGKAGTDAILQEAALEVLRRLKAAL